MRGWSGISGIGKGPEWSGGSGGKGEAKRLKASRERWMSIMGAKEWGLVGYLQDGNQN